MKRILVTIFCLITLPSMAASLIIDADKQAYDYKTNTLNFSGNVKVKMDNITVESPSAKAQVDSSGKLSSAVFSHGAIAIQDNLTSKNQIKANIINVSLLDKTVKANGSVVSTVNEANKPLVTISSDVQEFDTKTNIMNANGNVSIDYKNVKTSSQEAQISIDKNGNLKKVELKGNGKVSQKNSNIIADNFVFSVVENDMIATGNAYSETTLEDGEKVKVYSDYQHFDKNKNTMITTGNVKIHYKGYIATGPKAEFLPDSSGKKPNKIIFHGRSKIKEFNREIEADKIQMTLNPRGFNAEGNVRSWFQSVEGLSKKK